MHLAFLLVFFDYVIRGVMVSIKQLRARSWNEGM